MAATHAKHHDYHLVNPSPWPLTASISVLFMAVGLIIWMRSMSGGAGLFGAHGPWVFIVGFTGVAATAFMWWRDVIREGVRGRPHSCRSAPPPLRHDPLHRLRGDVLRRLVLGLFRRGSVPRRRARPSELDRRRRHGHPRPAHRRPLAAAARRRHRRDDPGQRRSDARHVRAHLRSVAHPARQHADPADLGRDGDVGAPRAAAQQPPRPDHRPHPDRAARRHLHLLPGLRVRARRLQLRRAHLRLDVLHGDGLPRRARHHRHDLPHCVPVARARRVPSRPRHTSASRRRPGTGTSSTWCGCSSSPASTSGALGPTPAATSASRADRSTRIPETGRRLGAPF